MYNHPTPAWRLATCHPKLNLHFHHIPGEIIGLAEKAGRISRIALPGFGPDLRAVQKIANSLF
jgi:hypothetical protein